MLTHVVEIDSEKNGHAIDISDRFDLTTTLNINSCVVTFMGVYWSIIIMLAYAINIISFLVIIFRGRLENINRWANTLAYSYAVLCVDQRLALEYDDKRIKCIRIIQFWMFIYRVNIRMGQTRDMLVYTRVRDVQAIIQ